MKNKNLGLIVASVFKGTFHEKDEALKIYFNEFFESLANKFLDSFFEKQN